MYAIVVLSIEDVRRTKVLWTIVEKTLIIFFVIFFPLVPKLEYSDKKIVLCLK